MFTFYVSVILHVCYVFQMLIAQLATCIRDRGVALSGYKNDEEKEEEGACQSANRLKIVVLRTN